MYIAITKFILISSTVMAQILDSLPNDDNSHILCCYVNATSQIQIARITNIPNWYFERVVFPGQRLVFEAEPQGILEIHSGMMASAILSDTIPCSRLALEAVSARQNDKAKEKAASADISSGGNPKSGRTDAIAPSLNIAV